MYALITGPLLWLTFAVFVGGLAWRVYTYIKGLDWKLDRVAYATQREAGIRGAVRSIVAWLVPYGSHGWRAKPIFTFLFFAFHIGLVVVPLFLAGHAVILKMRFGIGWPTIPMALADVLTTEGVAIGIARSAVGGIALALAVPLTTAVAAALATPATGAAPEAQADTGHTPT